MSINVFIQILAFGIATGSLYALVSIGLTLIFGVLRLVNFAHGEFLMLSMYAAFWAYSFFNISPYISILFIIPIFFLIGVAVQYIFIRPIVEKHFSTQILVTLGLSLVISRGALLSWGPAPRIITSDFVARSLTFCGIKLNYGQLLMFLVSTLIITILFIFLYKTYIGKVIRAVAQDRKGAKLLGIDVSKIYLITFGIGIACVAGAGSIMTPIFTTAPSIGTTFVMLAFIIVVLGGYSSLFGTLIAAYIIAFVEVFTSYLITPHIKEAVMFSIFIIILLIKPKGLLSSK